MPDLAIPVLIFIAIVVLYLLNSIKILREYERGVIFRLGRVSAARPRGPASSWSSGPSTRWCASRCARTCWRFRRRT